MAASVVAALLLAACGEATAPANEHFDTIRVNAGVSTVEKASASAGVASLDQLVRFGGGAAVTVAGRADRSWDRGLAAAVQHVVGGATDAGAYLVPVMRPSILGKVLVYDPAQRRYVPSTRTGAPSNGVRFILYAQSSSGDPIPTQEIGHADLTDEGRNLPSRAEVRLLVVIGTVTRLSYTFALGVAEGPPNFSVQGFIVDGDDRLNFTIRASSSVLAGGAATVDATLAAPRQGFEVHALLTATPDEASNGTIDLTLSSGTDEVKVDAATVNGRLDATFTVNGTLLARATGSPSDPDIRGEGGRPLTEAEVRALHRIVDVADAVFKLVGELVEPAGWILLVALGIGG